MIGIEILMDVATILFFVASFPQIRTVYRRRKKGLNDLNMKCYFMWTFGVIFVAIYAMFIGIWVTAIIQSWMFTNNISTIYWIYKYR